MQPLSEIEEKYVKGWSWGAFIGTWVYLFVNKQYKLGWKVLFLFLFVMFLTYAPWMNILSFTDVQTYSPIRLIYFGVAVWLGIRGREMAWKGWMWPSFDEFKKRQRFAAKFAALYITLTIILSTALMFVLFLPYASNPALIDAKIMKEALVQAQSNNPNLNTAEFEAGYQKGLTDGQGVDMARSFVADKTQSYQDGYTAGFVVSCMRLKDDQALCTKKTLGGE